MSKYPSPLTKLMHHLQKLPGIGAKTAERFAFELLEWTNSELEQFSTSLSLLKQEIHRCEECNCIAEEEKCTFCSDSRRDHTHLCITSSAKEVFLIEETKTFRGLYHVLGGLLSPMSGISLSDLHLDKLKERIEKYQVREVMIALDSTLEGDTTALHLKREFDQWGITSSRLAFGLPMGSSLDFVDKGTLSHAITKRYQM